MMEIATVDIARKEREITETSRKHYKLNCQSKGIERYLSSIGLVIEAKLKLRETSNSNCINEKLYIIATFNRILKDILPSSFQPLQRRSNSRKMVRRGFLSSRQNMFCPQIARSV